MRLPSIRFQFAIALIVINVAVAATLASFAYTQGRESLTRQAVASAHVVADAREYALTRDIESQHDRLSTFLTSLDSLCGERVTSRAIDWELECVHVALTGFQRAERATAVELRNGPRRIASIGAVPRDVSFTNTTQLAALVELPTGPGYVMQVAQGRALVRALYPVANLAGLFSDRSGLQAKGANTLIDRKGQVLIPPSMPATDLPASVPLARAIDQCLTGDSAEVLSGDAPGHGVLAGLQPVTAFNDGCVITSLDYAEALEPINRLERLVVVGAAVLIVLAMVVSWIIARTITTRLASLAAAASQIEGGRFDTPIPRGGPAEVRQLGRALSRMAKAVGDLVQREKEARLEAETANRTKDDFLGTLSHELRTPLTAIVGWVSMLRQRKLDPAREEHALRVIERSARTEARLVEDLLDVTRIVNGQMRLKITEVSMIGVVDAAMEAVRPAAELKGVALNRHVEGDVATVVGDPHRLQQIVWNLLANSVRFTTRGGRVDVTLRPVGTTTELSVSDTGIGIAPELLPHVFERFRQGDTGTMRAHGGLGLGLAIVRHLVELHGGTVRAQSDGEGHGSSFTVVLPAAPHRAIDRPAGRDAPLDVDLRGTCILVVDDDPDAREVVRAMLEGAGASVATTASARDTRALVDRLRPDVLIADIGMPDEDGYSLMKWLRAQERGERHLPAIALTAHARAEDVERALESGFEIHVAKPIDATELLATVSTLLRPAA
ncbi:MAG TPA: ATP-binding protein [Vicinamibacterales bacterium]|nr:ATP-binding protein [Vicinamibacterales bacterium]